MTDATNPNRSNQPDLVEVIGDAIFAYYDGFGQHPGVTRAYGAAEAVVAALGRRRPDLEAPATELAEMRHVFEMHWTRMATERWRAEDPVTRALMMPDLGDLLKWLMDDADRARAEVVRLHDLIRHLADEDECWFDHHGGCRAHGYLSLKPGERCPQQEVRELLTERTVEG